MIKYIIGIFLVAALAIFGISIYLQPDDLSVCHEQVTGQGNCHTVDAIVAVSGGDTDARASEAITLFKNGWSNELIFSGAAEDKSGPSNAAAMRQLAINAGVPAGDIAIDEYSDTTKQNAENVENIFTSDNIKSVILVTSGYHQRRASLDFHAHASGVIILNHPTSNDQDWSQIWWWTSPRGWWLAVSELFKIGAFYIGIGS